MSFSPFHFSLPKETDSLPSHISYTYLMHTHHIYIHPSIFTSLHLLLFFVFLIDDSLLLPFFLFYFYKKQWKKGDQCLACVWGKETRGIWFAIKRKKKTKKSSSSMNWLFHIWWHIYIQYPPTAAKGKLASQPASQPIRSFAHI